MLLKGVARTHIKGRLLDQAVILFNCIPFQMGTSLKGKNLLPEGANSFLYEQFLIVWKITYITLSAFLECYYIVFLLCTCVNCVMGAMPMLLWQIRDASRMSGKKQLISLIQVTCRFLAKRLSVEPEHINNTAYLILLIFYAAFLKWRKDQLISFWRCSLTCSTNPSLSWKQIHF